MSESTRRIARVVAIVAALTPIAAPAQGTQARGDDPGGAARYFYETRAYPYAKIPARARMAAMDQMRARWPRLFAQRDALALSVPNLSPSTTWTPLGPSPIGTTPGSLQTHSGRLNSIAIHPTDPNTIYVAGAQGGIWKTTNGGTTWTALTDSQCSLAMGSVAIDPVNPSIVYAGTGELNNSGDSYYGCGVLKSTDAGATWTELGKTTFDVINGGARISKVLVDKATAGSATTTVVFAASSFGLFRSSDGGITWGAAVLAGIATDIVQDPTTPATLYAALGQTSGPSANGIYKSTNGGTTWTKLLGANTPPTSILLPATNVGRINLAISPSSPSTVYMAIEDANDQARVGTDGALLGLYVTADGGATWKQPAATSAQPMCGSNTQCWYDMVVAVDPTNANTVYFGGFSLYKSIDGGGSFTDIGTSIHVDHHAIAFDPLTPTTMFAGSDGGIYKSTNSGATGTWTSLNTNLVLAQFYAGVSVSPTTATVILGGTQDNGTLQANSISLSNWPSVLGGDGGFTAIDQLTGGVAFAETQWGTNGPGPRRRDPPSTFFTVKNAGINTSDRAQFIPPLVMDPARPRIVYFGTSNLYRTANFGDQWTNIGSSLVNSTGNINTIGVAASDSLTVYVGSSDGRVSYTHDLGTTWLVANGPGGSAMTDIAVDPRDARTAIVVQSGFVTNNKVWRTTDGGLNWSNLVFDLANIPVLAVVLEPGSRDITIGTDLGVFTLRNGTQTWVPVVNGLPNVAIYDLVYDAPRSRLIAATHGRGMFSLDVTVTGLRGDVTGSGGGPDGTVAALDAQAILAMVVGNAPPVGSTRYPNADANCDGQVTALDALIVLTKVANSSFTNSCVGTTK